MLLYLHLIYSIKQFKKKVRPNRSFNQGKLINQKVSLTLKSVPQMIKFNYVGKDKKVREETSQ